MLHVDYKKLKWCPHEFKKRPRRPVDFQKMLCRPVKSKKEPCRKSLRPKNGCVALSILGVYIHNSVIFGQIWYVLYGK